MANHYNLGAASIVKHFMLISLLLYVASMGVNGYLGQQGPLVKHIVINRFQPYLTQQQIDDIIAQYANLKNLVPVLKEWKWGVDLGPEVEDRADGFTHSFESTFLSVEDLNTFLAAKEIADFAKVFFPASNKSVVVNYVFNETYPPSTSSPAVFTKTILRMGGF